MAVLQQIKFLVLICAIGLYATASAQELAQLREEVRTSTDQPSSKPYPKSQQPYQRNHRDAYKTSLSGNRCDDDVVVDVDKSGFWAQTMFAGLSSPFWFPRSIVGDQSFGSGYFLRYPYLHDEDAAIDENTFTADVNRHLMVRTRGEYVSNFDELSKVGGSVLFDTALRWGLDSEFNYRREDLRSSKDSLWTGDANLVFRFCQSKQVQMRTGIGFNWLSDQSNSDFGFNFTYGGDWFPTKPVIVSHEIDWGKLGHASLFHGRVTVGANYHRFEPYVGYEYFSVGNANFNGLVLGTRLWLSRF